MKIVMYEQLNMKIDHLLEETKHCNHCGKRRCTNCQDLKKLQKIKAKLDLRAAKVMGWLI